MTENPCQCTSIPSATYTQLVSLEWLEELETVSPGNWCELKKCIRCEERWRIDVMSHGGMPAVVRVGAAEDWEGLDRTKEFKDLFVRGRGGTIERSCIKAGCDSECLKGFWLCPEHLWINGTRL